jgi:hypothetical protein
MGELHASLEFEKVFALTIRATVAKCTRSAVTIIVRNVQCQEKTKKVA